MHQASRLDPAGRPNAAGRSAGARRPGGPGRSSGPGNPNRHGSPSGHGNPSGPGSPSGPGDPSDTGWLRTIGQQRNPRHTGLGAGLGVAERAAPAVRHPAAPHRGGPVRRPDQARGQGATGRPRPGRRRRWLAAAIITAVTAVLATVAGAWIRTQRSPGPEHPPIGGAGTGANAAAASRSPARPRGFANQRPAPAAKATGRFQFAEGDGPVLGAGGRQYRFRIAVEEGSGVELADFTGTVEGTLGDQKSWIASGSVRLQRVGSGAAADFTVHLATPATTEKLCVAGGISTIINGVPYTSCRVGTNVVLNLDRYLTAVPNYGADLRVYQQYVVNHEVGHFLGHGHEGCPAAGRPAPVMMQQTLSLSGCVANAWPYLDGKLYSGPPVGP